MNSFISRILKVVVLAASLCSHQAARAQSACASASDDTAPRSVPSKSGDDSSHGHGGADGASADDSKAPPPEASEKKAP